ncbi:MAG: acyltransferase [Rhodospirillales bacterium]|nr:acyltransferase [Rhodospirillales bacterium]
MAIEQRPAARFHEIDGLRALAVTLVLIHHGFSGPIVLALRASGWTLLSDLVFDIGASGVDLFFVLSGVVLLRPYLRRERPFDVATYFRRRIARLWPPYLAALAAAGLVVLILTRFPTWYGASLLPAFDPGDWLAQAAIFNFGWPSYNAAWWSLTVELIFYVVAPLVVLLLRSARIGRAGFVWLVVAAIACSVIALQTGPAGAEIIAPPSAALRSFLVYLPCFLWGALIAKFDFSVAAGRRLAGAGAIAAVAAVPFPAINLHAACGTMFAGLVIAAADRGSVAHGWLTRPVTVWLGERSYSLFLVHFSVFYLVNWSLSLVLPGRTLLYGVLTRAIGLPLAFLAAVVLFTTIERRFARNLATGDAFAPWQIRRRTGAPHPEACPPITIS